MNAGDHDREEVIQSGIRSLTKILGIYESFTGNRRIFLSIGAVEPGKADLRWDMGSFKLYMIETSKTASGFTAYNVLPTDIQTAKHLNPYLRMVDWKIVCEE